jgi:hypothetical protein
MSRAKKAMDTPDLTDFLPLSTDVWKAVSFYRDLAESAQGLDEEGFLRDCLAYSNSGEWHKVLVELGELRSTLEEDSTNMISLEYMLNNVKEWRVRNAVKTDASNPSQPSMTNAPVEVWVTMAWSFVQNVRAMVEKAIELVRNSRERPTQLEQPPDVYSPLAKILWSYRDEFTTDVQIIVNYLKQGKGTIVVACQKVGRGAFILHEIQTALGIDARSLRDVLISFPNADREASKKERRWFDRRNTINDLANKYLEVNQYAIKGEIMKYQLHERLKVTTNQVRELVKAIPLIDV